MALWSLHSAYDGGGTTITDSPLGRSGGVGSMRSPPGEPGARRGWGGGTLAVCCCRAGCKGGLLNDREGRRGDRSASCASGVVLRALLRRRWLPVCSGEGAVGWLRGRSLMIIGFFRLRSRSGLRIDTVW